MISAVSGSSLGSVGFSCSIVQGKSVRLRTAFKSPTSNAGLGEVEGMMFKSGDKTMVFGYNNKKLERPNIGIPVFTEDLYRTKAHPWELAANAKISDGIIGVNSEPGLWVLCPVEDMEIGHYRTQLQRMEWKRTSKIVRKRVVAYGEGGVPQLDKTGLAPLDSLIVQAMERYIQTCFYRIGYSKHADEVAHLENDIARTRNYLKYYKQATPNSQHDAFLSSGSFVREKSLNSFVFRPKSEVFRTAIAKEIYTLNHKAQKAEKDKEEGKQKLFQSQSTILEEFSKNFFPPKQIQPEVLQEKTQESKKALPEKLQKVVDKVKQEAKEKKGKNETQKAPGA